MCVIISMETKVPEKSVFELCEKKNKDGGGISWISRGRVHYKKGIDATEIYDIAAHVGPPCVAHFRISTIGGVPKELCHPFVVSKKSPITLEGECDSVLFHNGHWSDWQDVCKEMVFRNNAVFPEDDMSDSRAMAWVTAHCNPSWIRFTKGQRVVIQTSKTRLYYGDWKEKDDVYYSNMNWEEKKPDDAKGWWKKHGAVGYTEGLIPYGVDSAGNTLYDFANESSDDFLKRKGYNV